MNAVIHLNFSVAILTDIYTEVTFITAGVINPKENIDAA